MRDPTGKKLRQLIDSVFENDEAYGTELTKRISNMDHIIKQQRTANAHDQTETYRTILGLIQEYAELLNLPEETIMREMIEATLAYLEGKPDEERLDTDQP